jgi:hypothetical protein
VPRPGLILGLALALVFPASALGGGALVEYRDIVLRADGTFAPRTLPKRGFAPIRFQGHFDIESRSGGRPATLSQAVIKFDSDGRLDARGLPTCSAESIAQASVEEARAMCKGAIVGTGRVGATIALASGLVPASSELTVFNAPPIEGHPAVILHAQTTVPGTQTFAIPVPLERIRGPYSYRATINVPTIAAGLGSLTHLDLKIGRLFRSGGHERSYVAARCSVGDLLTRGRFTFSDGTVIEGSVEKFCRAK